jgi:hypothetical protein
MNLKLIDSGDLRECDQFLPTCLSKITCIFAFLFKLFAETISFSTVKAAVNELERYYNHNL